MSCKKYLRYRAWCIITARIKRTQILPYCRYFSAYLSKYIYLRFGWLGNLINTFQLTKGDYFALKFRNEKNFERILRIKFRYYSCSGKNSRSWICIVAMSTFQHKSYIIIFHRQFLIENQKRHVFRK